MSILSYLTSTLGVIVLVISASVLCIGGRAVDEIEALIPFSDLVLKHPGIGLGLGIALFIIGRSVFDRRSSILWTSSPR